MASLSLAFDILARDKGASRTFKDVGDAARKSGDDVERAGKKGAGFGDSMKKAAGVAAAAFAAAGIGQAFTGFVSDAADAAKIGRLTEAVVKSTSGAAKISADQVARLSEAISNKTAVDDEAIQSGANLLLTFTKVRNEVGAGNDIFNQATQAAVDMSTALGTDVTSASLQLGKALNDPIKGVTALSKAGVSFTQEQKDQIRTMVEAGDVLGAQKIILGEMAVQFGGAAEAAAAPLDRLKVVAGNLGEQVGGALLPHIERFATYLGETVAPAIADFLQGMEDGTGKGGAFAAGFATIREGAGVAFGFFRDEVLPRLRDFAGFIRDEVIPRLQDFAGYVRDVIAPELRQLRDRFVNDVLPGMGKVRDFLQSTFQPAFERLVGIFNEKVRPVLGQVRDAFNENRPAMEKVAALVGAVIGVFLALHAKATAFLLPILGEIASFLLGRLADSVVKIFNGFGDFVDVVSDLTGWFSDALRNVKKFTDKLDEYKLPGWVKTLADTVGNIAGNLSAGAGKLAAFFGTGDGPGRAGVQGGSTLARVRPLLPSGAVITSTYRSAAMNRAAGGSPSSYHMDRNNPAVDIAGSRQAMDLVHARLAAIGGWRELLYKTKGHWDHVHVAHKGGMVSPNWPSMPGWRADERPVRAKVGERILPVGESAPGGGNINITGTFVGLTAQEVARELHREVRQQAAVSGLRRVAAGV